MSKVVSKIINKCNNSEEAKLNILIHQFDIDTELAISKTGHNFFRVQIDDSKDVIDKAKEYTNFFILPIGQVPFCFDYDMIIAKNSTFSQKFLEDMHYRLEIPFLIIDQEREEFEERMAFTTRQDKDSEDFIEHWTILLEKFRGIYT